MKLLNHCRYAFLLAFSALFLNASSQCAFNVNTEVISNASCNGASDGVARANVSGSEYQELNLGKLKKKPGAGGDYSAFRDGLYFEVNIDTLILDTVTVYPRGTGNVVVRIRDTASNMVVSTTEFPVIGATGAATKIPIGAILPPGSVYNIDANGSTISWLYRNTTSITYPYQSAYNVLNIVAPNNGTNFYYFFYDWSVTIIPSVNFSWSTGASTPSITGLAAGSYTVTVTDNNSCSFNQPSIVTVYQPSPVNVNLSVSSLINCYGKDEGEIFVNPSGSEISYVNQGQTTQINGGYYANYSDGLRFNVNSDSLTIDDVHVYADGDGNVVVNIFDSVGTKLHADTQFVTGNVASLLGPSAEQININYTLPRGNNYTISATGTVNSGGGLYRVSSGSTYPIKTPGGALEITGPINNLAGFYYFFFGWNVTEKQALSISWSNAANTDTISNLEPGNYGVTVTSSNGCASSDSQVLDTPYDEPLSIGSLVYDEFFENGRTYCGEDANYDNWLSLISGL